MVLLGAVSNIDLSACEIPYRPEKPGSRGVEPLHRGSLGAAAAWVMTSALRYELYNNICSYVPEPKTPHLTAEARSACILAASVPSSRVWSWNQGCRRASLALIRLAGSNANILCSRSRKLVRKGFEGGIISWKKKKKSQQLFCTDTFLCQSLQTSNLFMFFTNRRDALVVSVTGYSSLSRLK